MEETGPKCPTCGDLLSVVESMQNLVSSFDTATAI